MSKTEKIKGLKSKETKILQQLAGLKNPNSVEVFRVRHLQVQLNQVRKTLNSTYLAD